MAFLADSWAGCRCYFTHALALSYTPLWMVLLSLVVFDCVRASGALMLARGKFAC